MTGKVEPKAHSCEASTTSVMLQEVCKGIRTEREEQAALQQQYVQQQEQLQAADAQHSTAQANLAALRLTALHGTPDKLLEQVCLTIGDVPVNQRFAQHMASMHVCPSRVRLQLQQHRKSSFGTNGCGVPDDPS